MYRYHTDFLVPEDSFSTGMGTIFNLGGGFYSYNRSASPNAADARAIAQDFAMVGQDIKDIAAKVENGQATQLSLGL